MTTTISDRATDVVTSEFRAFNRTERGTRVAAERQQGRRLRRWIALALMALVAIAIWQFWYGVVPGAWTSVSETVSSPEQFHSWIASLGAWAPVAYFLAEVVQVIVPPIPGGIFPSVAATLFGPELALLLTMAGTTLGSAIVFALVRRWGRPLLERIASPRTIDRYAHIVTASGGIWLLLVMIVPILPGDSLSALMGSSAISFRRFLIVTTLGRLPTTLCGVYLTTGLLSIPPEISILAGAIALLAMAIGFRKRDRLEGWLLRQADEQSVDH